MTEQAKNVFINADGGTQNIVQGKNAIAKQVNTVVQQVMSGVKGKKSSSRTVISQHVNGSGNTVISQHVNGSGHIFSSSGNVTINGVKMPKGEYVSINDGNVVINNGGYKMKQDGRCFMDVLDDIKTEVSNTYGSAGDDFLYALESLIKNPASTVRQALLTEESAALGFHNNETILQLISELMLHLNDAEDETDKEIKRLRKEAANLNPKIKKVYNDLLDIAVTECKSSIPNSELVKRIFNALKILIGEKDSVLS